ncbi:hypothetical protein E2562_038307 [Oryza meyeriana var. granulata]|uniref:Retrotransposon gag domain-containing protein n=1 Tax=Oryza meyeriana var. granulata TaxID=110450 RepID=A0A6G1EDA7_9ORYZ|nr:hypothetical protein E2562_038307 [Oryza meyeriana var. granulata]
MECKLEITQCSDGEKVCFTVQQLEGAALDWYKNLRADRQRHFLKGLNFGLKVGLVAHDFSSFQSLVNKTLLLEEERRKLGEDRKRKMHQNIGGPSQR